MQPAPAMSGLDYMFELAELAALEGGFLNNVYDEGDGGGRFRLKFNIDGERNVRVELGRRIHLTAIIPKAPATQSSFTKMLRARLGNARVAKVEQLGGMDRIIKFTFANGLALVFESFARGNAFLLDGNGEILRPMLKDSGERSLQTGKPYGPPGGKKPIAHADATDSWANGGKVIDAITAAYGITPGYGREAAWRAGVDPLEAADGLDGKSRAAIAQSLRSLCSDPRPRIYELADGSRAFSPVVMGTLEGRGTCAEFPSFWECLDAFYSVTPKTATAKKNPATVKLEKIDASIRQLEEGRKAIELQAALESAKAEWLYTHYQEVVGAIDAARRGDGAAAAKAVGKAGAKARLEKGALVIAVDDEVD